MGEIFKTQEEKEHWLKQVQRIKKWCVDCEYEEEGPLGDPCHECLGCDIPSNADSYIPLCYKEKNKNSYYLILDISCFLLALLTL